MSVLIRNARVIDPASSFDAEADLLIREGVIEQAAAPGQIAGADDILEAKGLVATPGFIDLHVHLREPGQSHKETIATGTMAAAAGGFTSLCCMPNTDPVNDLPAITRWMLQPERGAVVNVFPIAAATVGSAGEKLTDFAALRREGAVAVTDDGRPILHDGIMRSAMLQAAALGMPVIQHAEDTALTRGGSMHQGARAFRMGLRGMPAEAEWSVVRRDIQLARETGAHLHVAHISTAEAVEAVREARRHGIQVSCEVTPHHFALADDDIREYDANFKMNPPLRSPADREAMIVGLLDGTIDAIATDHAPHALHEKRQEFDRAPFGITGSETALGLALSILYEGRGLPLDKVIALLTARPAQILRGSEAGRRGTLAPGAPADIVIFDPSAKWRYEAANSKSKSQNTPFDGWEMRGRVMATMVGGEFVFRGE
ncbi:MAG: dihydroorotase [Acidobacteria bacterium]|nr:dihydroorotase [Acidobacteriota bacterium]